MTKTSIRELRFAAAIVAIMPLMLPERSSYGTEPHDLIWDIVAEAQTVLDS